MSNMNYLQCNVQECRARQRRLLEVMHARDIDLAIVCRLEHVQWLVGPRFWSMFEPAAALDAAGRVTLVAPVKPPQAAADDTVIYASKWLSTLRNDQRQASSEALWQALDAGCRGGRVAVEFSAAGPWITAPCTGPVVDLEPDLYRLRRRKHADELAMLRTAIAATGVMYARAREVVRPGVLELEVFNELQAVAVREFGELIAATGNDYQAGSRGGPPRPRRAEDGELYILDLGPAYRGYNADNSRTLAVNGRPTDAQAAAHARVAGVFDIIARRVRPGVRCRSVFAEVQAYLDEFMPGSFNHHLGHGIGLNPHEAPHLNPNWDDTFEEGDVFTAEPGLYGPDLRAGIRLENDYLVTADGVENLSDFPLGL